MSYDIERKLIHEEKHPAIEDVYPARTTRVYLDQFGGLLISNDGPDGGVVYLDRDAIAAILAALQPSGGDAVWQDIATAPKDAEFLALQDGEIYHARIEDGRLQWRTHTRWQSTTDIVKQVEHEGHTVEAKIRTHESPETFDHHWTLWTRGFDFKPTHWQPLPPPPSARTPTPQEPK